MFVKKVLFFDKNSREAAVLVSDGKYDLMCYLFPAESASVSICCDVGIFGVLCGEIVRSDRTSFFVRKMPQYFSYFLTAQVIESEKKVVRIGNIIINIDSPIPKDIINGEYIDFFVSRLDL